jgi:hypothetical protein
MTPLLSQPTLTPSQAATIRTKLDAILTAAQREAIAQTPERFGRRDGPPGDGQPAMPSDDRREVSGHQRPGLPPENMENVNPFNPDSDHPMAARMAQRWQAVFDALDAKARQ